MLHWKWGDRDSGTCEQVIIIKELSDAVKKHVPLALCPNDLVRCEALAFLDIPYDVRVDTAAFLGQQITPHISEKKSAQHLKAIYRAREIRCLLVYHAT